jgi:hypothetical protein
MSMLVPMSGRIECILYTCLSLYLIFINLNPNLKRHDVVFSTQENHLGDSSMRHLSVFHDCSR